MAENSGGAGRLVSAGSLPDEVGAGFDIASFLDKLTGSDAGAAAEPQPVAPAPAVQAPAPNPPAPVQVTSAPVAAEADASPVEAATAATGDWDPQRVAAVVAAWTACGGPLLSAVCEREPDEAARKERFAEVLGVAAGCAQALAEEAGARLDGSGDWARWALLKPAAAVVASVYRDRGKVGADIGQVLRQASRDLILVMPDGAGQLGGGSILAAWLEALEPAVGAALRYPFGRPPGTVVRDAQRRLEEVVWRFVDRMDLSEEQSVSVKAALLPALGRVYANCHHDEVDRLQGMGASERSEYAAKHGGTPPMDPVWQAFQQWADILLEVAAAIVLPAGAVVVGPPGGGR